MISAGLAVEGHARGLGLPGHPYMTYAEPWRGASAAPPPKQAEFLRPAPKPLIPPSRHNGSASSAGTINGVRMFSQTQTSTSRSSVKYPSPPSSATPGPVNLTQQQVKEDSSNIGSSEELSAAAAAAASYSVAAVYNRIHLQQPNFTGIHYQTSLPGVPGPYSLYQSPYSSLIRPNFVQPPPLSPLETYSPPATATSPATFVSPPATFSTPAQVPLLLKAGQSVLREKRSSTNSSISTSTSSITSPSTSHSSGGNFKVPSGKEGSLKHRILTRPPGENASSASGVISRKRLSASSALSPPATPTKPTLNTNNNTIPGNFTKGSMIQLSTGQLRRVEDMTTEDFVLSADKSPELRLAESTVVKIDENPITGTATITLSYNKNRTQVEFEAVLEHPFFVYGQSWASCNPERTLQCYGLKVDRLQVGDIVISLTPREPKEPSFTVHSNGGGSSSNSSSKSSPMITTTATTTAMTARQISRTNVTSTATSTTQSEYAMRLHVDKTLLPPPAPVTKTSVESLDASNARKRRWSAPDQICDEDEQATTRRHKE